jgi:hypothetical protein
MMDSSRKRPLDGGFSPSSSCTKSKRMMAANDNSPSNSSTIVSMMNVSNNNFISNTSSCTNCSINNSMMDTYEHDENIDYERILREALEKKESNHFDTMNTMTMLAIFLRQMNRIEEASALYKRIQILNHQCS